MLDEIKMSFPPIFRARHTSETAVNNEDPDDGNSWSCSACTLPIFSTPFESRDKLLVHDGCANLPKELTAHTLHPKDRLVLKANQDSSSCSQCHKECGSMMYECPNEYCRFKLDLLCALQITISHRSHRHRLKAIAGSNSFMCGACGTQHPGFSTLSCLCKGCDFWIHPNCASLPNAIYTLHHQHSLFLTYNLRYQFGNQMHGDLMCSICRSVEESWGMYLCAKCGYYAHIKCVVSDPHSYERVLIRDAELAGMCHFPMTDEHSSVMPYIMKDIMKEVDEHSSVNFFRQNLHQHPLMFHDEDKDSDGQSSRICNACAQLISCKAFYKCSECPDLFLHKCCVNLPTQFQHPSHEHPLTLFPKARDSSTSGCFLCLSCGKPCNRFSYSCNTCRDPIISCVVCVMMPPLITHHLHGKSHILFSRKGFMFRSYYRCSTCPNFEIDSWSAQLPSCTKHKFDKHPLKLTASDGYTVKGPRICEICEDEIKSYRVSINSYNWYYSCSQCEQSFHCECIHGFSNFKLGGTIRVNCHDCPLTLIPESTVYGYRCNYCQEVFNSRFIENLKPAYECSECYFRIHDDCAGKCLVSGE